MILIDYDYEKNKISNVDQIWQLNILKFIIFLTFPSTLNLYENWHDYEDWH